jgi:hypothetical protein
VWPHKFAALGEAVSKDTSRPSAYRLEDPDPGGGGPGGTAAGSRELPDPPWINVIGTTVRLWLRRRVLRVPDSGRIGMRRTAAVLAAVVVVAGNAVAITLLTVHAHDNDSHKQSFVVGQRRHRPRQQPLPQHRRTAKLPPGGSPPRQHAMAW